MIKVAKSVGQMSSLEGPLIVAPSIFLFMIFPIGILKTLSGYASLMKKGRVQELDGTVADKSILDGVRGKLKEVFCEAAPQSLLQLCCWFGKQSCFVKVYILLKSRVHVWHQVVATALSLISLSKLWLCYESIWQNTLKTIFIPISKHFNRI